MSCTPCVEHPQNLRNDMNSLSNSRTLEQRKHHEELRKVGARSLVSMVLHPADMSDRDFP